MDAENLKETLNQLTQALPLLGQSMQEAVSKARSADDEVESLSARYDKTRTEVEALQVELAEMLDALAKACDEHDTAAKEAVADLEEKLEALENAVYDGLASLDTARESVVAAMDGLEKQLADASTALDPAGDLAQGAVDKVVEALEGAQAEIEEALGTLEVEAQALGRQATESEAALETRVAAFLEASQSGRVETQRVVDGFLQALAAAGEALTEKVGRAVADELEAPAKDLAEQFRARVASGLATTLQAARGDVEDSCDEFTARTGELRSELVELRGTITALVDGVEAAQPALELALASIRSTAKTVGFEL